MFKAVAFLLSLTFVGGYSLLNDSNALEQTRNNAESTISKIDIVKKSDKDLVNQVEEWVENEQLPTIKIY